jgi:Zn-dependent protease with chaperone function
MGNIKKNRNHKYLCYTILLLIISIFYYLSNDKKLIINDLQSNIEYVLALLLIVTIVFSQMFWNNPIKNSKIHKMDAIIAKIVMLSFAIYTIKYKFKIFYV